MILHPGRGRPAVQGLPPACCQGLHPGTHPRERPPGPGAPQQKQCLYGTSQHLNSCPKLQWKLLCYLSSFYLQLSLQFMWIVKKKRLIWWAEIGKELNATLTALMLPQLWDGFLKSCFKIFMTFDSEAKSVIIWSEGFISPEKCMIQKYSKRFLRNMLDCF